MDMQPSYVLTQMYLKSSPVLPWYTCNVLIQESKLFMSSQQTWIHRELGIDKTTGSVRIWDQVLRIGSHNTNLPRKYNPWGY